VKRWVVRRGDGATVGEIVSKMREDDVERAIAEGRVFVGKKRATGAGERVREGDDVRLAPARGAARDGGVPILFDGDGLVACVKPAGIPTVPDHAGGSHALVALVARATGRSLADMRVTSRLDREVSGVVIFATDASAEAALKKAREEGSYVRRYVAFTGSGARLAEDAGTWRAPIGRGKDARHRAANGPDAKPATTHYRVVARAPRPHEDFALLAVEPVTGRTHQIRVHAAAAGAPLFGDRDYGGAARVTLAGGRVVTLSRIALHCARVVVPGSSGAPIDLRAPAPPELVTAWASVGGGARALDDAATAPMRE
jgi:23S rRNA-/tRNA-specific pseudouridylate synthase